MPNESLHLPSLLIHDGELSDVAELLTHLGLDFIERRGCANEADEAQQWELVISTPKRLLEFDPGTSGSVPMRMAVLDKDSKTLRAMLQRAGIDLIVRRPVHPAALRLLILHSLYRGPEKRRSMRVSIGARVKFRCGLRSRHAVLADLSATGCRLLSAHPLAPQQDVRIQIPDEVAALKAFAVSGKVVRATRSEFSGIDILAVRFGPLKPKHAAQLCKTLAAYNKGPAALATDDGDARLAFRATDRSVTRSQTSSHASTERRAGRRHVYEERIAELGVEAARVLLGRDISLGGMRVESHPDIRVGDELRIGLHVRGRDEPVELNSRVIRDDPNRGSVLQFFDLDYATKNYLNRMVRFLPILATRDGDEDGGVIVCEILEQLGEASTAA